MKDSLIKTDEAAREAFADFPDTEFGDHYETPANAFKHLDDIMKHAAKRLGKSRKHLCCYDPYFCKGAVVANLNTLKYKRVINQRRDFYADIRDGAVPAHEFLVTNPPYSSDHKERLLGFILEQQRAALRQEKSGAPFAVLFPAWTASKLAWRQFLWALARMRCEKDLSVTMKDASKGERSERVGAFSPKLEEKAGCFFIVPDEKYKFVAAVEARDTAPFFGVWFVGGFGGAESTAAAKAHAKKKIQQRKNQAVSSGFSLYNSLQELRDKGVVPSPQEERGTLSSKQREKRAEKLLALQNARESQNANPGVKKRRKKRKLEEARNRIAETCKFVVEANNEGVDKAQVEKMLSEVKKNKGACRHFFGTTGCTRGENCRFAHTV